MRVLLDTNVLVAAFISRGQCSDLFEYVGREHKVVMSEVVLREIRHALLQTLGFPEGEVIESFELVRLRSRVVEPMSLEEPACRDPDDNRILVTAVAGECECLLTGDGRGPAGPGIVRGHLDPASRRLLGVRDPLGGQDDATPMPLHISYEWLHAASDPGVT